MWYIISQIHLPFKLDRHLTKNGISQITTDGNNPSNTTSVSKRNSKLNIKHASNWNRNADNLTCLPLDAYSVSLVRIGIFSGNQAESENPKLARKLYEYASALIYYQLTYWGLKKMVDSLQTKWQNALESFVFWFYIFCAEVLNWR